MALSGKCVCARITGRELSLAVLFLGDRSRWEEFQLGCFFGERFKNITFIYARGSVELYGDMGSDRDNGNKRTINSVTIEIRMRTHIDHLYESVTRITVASVDIWRTWCTSSITSDNIYGRNG